jgi:ribosomal protein S18 acetylase RimI-like enzyme
MSDRIVMECALPSVASDTPRRPSRTLLPSDEQDLSILLYGAFRGSIDDEGETLKDAEEEIRRLFSGRYGRLLADCSFVMEGEEHLLSASLVTWFEGHDAPLIAFSMTRPEHRREGRARQLLEQSMGALSSRGYARATLVVTKGNTAAENLYRSLGFRPILSAPGELPGPV